MITSGIPTECTRHRNKTARGCESGPGATLTVDVSTLIDELMIMTDALHQTVADALATTVVHLM
jgi:hypothetical protein